eukprot:2457306-Amphidinium_carterae.1
MTQTTRQERTHTHIHTHTHTLTAITHGTEALGQQLELESAAAGESKGNDEVVKSVRTFALPQHHMCSGCRFDRTLLLLLWWLSWWCLFDSIKFHVIAFASAYS